MPVSVYAEAGKTRSPLGRAFDFVLKRWTVVLLMFIVASLWLLIRETTSEDEGEADA
jgi:hypothetical protein